MIPRNLLGFRILKRGKQSHRLLLDKFSGFSLNQTLRTTRVIWFLVLIFFVSIFAPTAFTPSSSTGLQQNQPHKSIHERRTHLDATSTLYNTRILGIRTIKWGTFSPFVALRRLRMCPFEVKRSPPILWSFPGSGNTWVRSLIHSSTGLHSGSIYNDPYLGKLAGEGVCNASVVCVKMHPNIHTSDILDAYHSIVDGRGDLLTITETNSAFWDRGRTQVIISRLLRLCGGQDSVGQGTQATALKFQKAVVIDRNPFEAAFSELQRIALEILPANESKSFNPHTFKLSDELFSDEISDLKDILILHYLRLGQEYVLSWKSYTKFRIKNGAQSLHVTQYDDFLSPVYREYVLSSMLVFMNVPFSGKSVRRSFKQKRSKTYSRQDVDKHASASPNRISLPEFLNLTYMNSTVLCLMWGIVSHVVEMREYEALLKQPNQFDHCDGLIPIDLVRNLNVNFSASTFSPNEISHMQRIPKRSAQLSGRRISDTLPSVEYEGQTQTLARPVEFSIDAIRKAKQAASRGRVVLLFAVDSVPLFIDSRQSHLIRLINSLLWMRRAKVDGILICVGDPASQKVVEEMGFHAFIMDFESFSDSPAQKSIYFARLRTIKTILAAGVDVLHCDLDAMFLQNPMRIIDQLSSKASIIASRGTFPFHLSEKWGGSSACMGFIFFASNHQVQVLVSKAINEAIFAHGDDQIGLNRALEAGNVKWHDKNQNFGTAYIDEDGRFSTTGIAMVSMEQVDRDCQNLSDETIVAHCYIPGTKSLRASEYAHKMNQLGLWYSNNFLSFPRNETFFSATEPREFALEQVLQTLSSIQPISKASRSRKLIIANVTGTTWNRLFVLETLIHLSKMYQRNLVVIWDRDDECDLAFDDIMNAQSSGLQIEHTTSSEILGFFSRLSISRGVRGLGSDLHELFCVQNLHFYCQSGSLNEGFRVVDIRHDFHLYILTEVPVYSVQETNTSGYTLPLQPATEKMAALTTRLFYKDCLEVQKRLVEDAKARLIYSLNSRP